MVLTEREWGGPPPIPIRLLKDIHDSGDSVLWWFCRVSVAGFGIFLIISGSIFSSQFAPVLEGPGTFMAVLGGMLLSTACLDVFFTTFLSLGQLAFVGACSITAIWSLITGLTMSATGERVHSRAAGVLITLTALVLGRLAMYVSLILMARVGDNTRDVNNLTTVLATASRRLAAQAGSPPSIVQLFGTPEFRTWFSPLMYGFYIGWLIIAIGGFTEAWSMKEMSSDGTETSVGENISNRVSETFSVVGRILGCVGGIVLTQATVAMLSEIVVDDNFPQALRRNLACLAACLLSFVWLLIVGNATYGGSDSIPKRFMGLLLILVAGAHVVVAVVLAALVYFGFAVSVMGFLTTDKTPVDLALPPDEELFPYMPRALLSICGDLESKEEIFYARQAWRILRSGPWRDWWMWQLLPAFLFLPMATLAGSCSVVRDWEVLQSERFKNVLDPLVYVLNVMTAFDIFLLLYNMAKFGPFHDYDLADTADTQWIRQVAPAQRAPFMLIPVLNFLWMLCTASSSIHMSPQGAIGAALIIVPVAAHQLHQAYLGLLADQAADGKGEIFGRLRSLLILGGRFNPTEVWRELQRDDKLREWHAIALKRFVVGFFLACSGELIKDVVPAVDSSGDRDLLGETTSVDMLRAVQEIIVWPVGRFLQISGSAIVLHCTGSRALQLVIPEILQTQADIILGCVNVVWVLPFACGYANADEVGSRVAAYMLFVVAIVLGWPCLIGGFMLSKLYGKVRDGGAADGVTSIGKPSDTDPERDALGRVDNSTDDGSGIDAHQGEPFAIRMKFVAFPRGGGPPMLTKSGIVWQGLNACCSAYFALIGLIMQGLWGPLSDGVADERAGLAFGGLCLVLLALANTSLVLYSIARWPRED